MPEERIEKEKNFKVFVTIVVLLLLIIMVVGVSVATITFTNQSEKVNTISTGNIALDFKEETNGIAITNAYPMTDDVGKILTAENQYFDFTVISTIEGAAVINYEVSAEKIASSTLDNKEVKLYLEEKEGSTYKEVLKPTNFVQIGETSEVGTPAANMILAKGSLSTSKTINYRLRMWVADNANVDDISRTFRVQVAINANVNMK